MRNKAQRRNRPRRLDYSVDLPFAVHQLPARYRPSLLAWLRRYARTLRWLNRAVALPRHTRTFYQLDPTTGTWEQL